MAQCSLNSPLAESKFAAVSAKGLVWLPALISIHFNMM